MQTIKLNATDSTNDHLKSLARSQPMDDFTVVVAKTQREGRGQMGAKWQSEAGKNLTFSLLKRHGHLVIEEGFQLNIRVSLAIVAALNEQNIPRLAVKWPNDILSGSSKICGILIENMLSSDKIQASIIGIGLNVNQVAFDNLENASSMKLLLGQTQNLDELLDNIIDHLKEQLLPFDGSYDNKLWNDYENLLFRKDKPSTFKNAKGELFMGIVRGVSRKGKLIVALENEALAEFDLKEVKLLY